MTPTLRPARLDDCGAIAALQVRSWQHAYRQLLPADYLDRLSASRRARFWRDAVASGEPRLLLAHRQQRLLGFAAYGAARSAAATDAATPSRAARGELWALYLDPPFWSRGVGRALWRGVCDRLLADGYASVELWVFADNAPARAFYRAVGCRVDAGSSQTFTLGGVTLEEIRYLWTPR